MGWEEELARTHEDKENLLEENSVESMEDLHVFPEKKESMTDYF